MTAPDSGASWRESVPSRACLRAQDNTFVRSELQRSLHFQLCGTSLDPMLRDEEIETDVPLGLERQASYKSVI